MLSCFIRKGGALGGIHSYAEAESGVESRADLGVGSLIFLPRLIYKIGAKLPPSLSLSFLPVYSLFTSTHALSDLLQLRLDQNSLCS